MEIFLKTLRRRHYNSAWSWVIDVVTLYQNREFKRATFTQTVIIVTMKRCGSNPTIVKISNIKSLKLLEIFLKPSFYTLSWLHSFSFNIHSSSWHFSVVSNSSRFTHLSRSDMFIAFFSLVHSHIATTIITLLFYLYEPFYIHLSFCEVPE